MTFTAYEGGGFPNVHVTDPSGALQWTIAAAGVNGAKLVAGQTYWFEVGSWRPDAPFAPPPNAEYFFNVALAPTPCLGDLNGDAVVDLADLIIQLANLGSTNASPEDGDLDGDGDDDIRDLVRLLARFNSAC